VAAGALSTLAMQTIVGVVTGTWLANASVLALACLAFSAGTAAMAALLGRAGVVVSVLVVFFFGFAFSGVATAWQFVPTPWGQVAQYLPVGALNTALRSVAFFGGASDAPALTVLGAWAALGLAASLLTRRASRVPAHHATPIPA
jgi:ABC-type polysaccharide/polyol phosphate export permease